MGRMHVRVLLIAAACCGAALFALSREARPALACTGPGPAEHLMYSQIIPEGRVISVVPAGVAGTMHSPVDITFAVVRGHKGARAGDTVVARGHIPVPGVPVPCRQFPQDLVGKYVIIGLSASEQEAGQLLADTMSMPFLGDEPFGEGYERGVKLAEMIADSNPAAPVVVLDPPTATCGQPLRISGRRFSEGKHLLRYSISLHEFAYRLIAVVDVGPGGSFETTTTIVANACRESRTNARLMSFHVSALHPAEQAVYGDLEEIVAAPIAGARDREPPSQEVSVTPDPARCEDTLTIRGRGFEPSEVVNIRVGGGPSVVRVTADRDGSFALRQAIPADTCDDPIIRVAVEQTGFDGDLSRWSPLAEAHIGRAADSPPGPPDVGSGSPPAANDEARWRVAMAGAALLMVVAAGAEAVLRKAGRE